MSTKTDMIVSRFRAGEAIHQIAGSLGVCDATIRVVLRRCMPARGTGRNRVQFQSRPDGEYALCPRCARIGYGADAWHPATHEFWPTSITGRRLSFIQCLACTSDVAARKAGVPLLRISA